MSFVLDASVSLAWCFTDEATPTTTIALDYLENNSAIVPEIWSLEVSNILVMAERRKRITYAGIIEFLSLIENLNICVDKETSARGFREILSIAHAEHMTTYDAAYLELAMRLGIPLATKDEHLLKIAKKLGVREFK